MSVWQTVLVFAGIPLAVIVVVIAAVYGRSTVHQPNRYRPGRPWSFPPAWYLPHPDAIGVPAGATQSGATPTTAVGGASGEW